MALQLVVGHKEAKVIRVYIVLAIVVLLPLTIAVSYRIITKEKRVEDKRAKTKEIAATSLKPGDRFLDGENFLTVKNEPFPHSITPTALVVDTHERGLHVINDDTVLVAPRRKR